MHLKFAQQSRSGLMWGPILEKAWAKIKGMYGNTRGGHFVNGLRTLIGIPLFAYKTKYFNTEEKVMEVV